MVESRLHNSSAGERVPGCGAVCSRKSTAVGSQRGVPDNPPGRLPATPARRAARGRRRSEITSQASPLFDGLGSRSDDLSAKEADVAAEHEGGEHDQCVETGAAAERHKDVVHWWHGSWPARGPKSSPPPVPNSRLRIALCPGG